jgi:anti-sigma factor RsiW
MSPIETFECARAKRAIHARLDGDVLVPEDRARLDAHLVTCDACRTLSTELEQIQRELQSIRVPGLAPAALDQVWEETSRAPARRRSPLRVAAWAAGLALLLGGSSWILLQQRERALHDQAELRRATTEARLVLAVAGDALRRTERVTTDRVLEGGIRQALDRTSIRWSGDGATKPPARRGNGA